MGTNDLVVPKGCLPGISHAMESDDVPTMTRSHSRQETLFTSGAIGLEYRCLLKSTGVMVKD